MHLHNCLAPLATESDERIIAETLKSTCSNSDWTYKWSWSTNERQSQSIRQRRLIYITLCYLGWNDSHQQRNNLHFFFTLAAGWSSSELQWRRFSRFNFSFCPTDLFGASASKALKPQRSLPGTPVSATHFPIDLRTSMEEKYKEIAEVTVEKSCRFIYVYSLYSFVHKNF